mgnify:CR=1 FL=1|jgi:hypothetical protein|tara:strand:- start:18 stop:182 length:165 start_codon:yes stop_codon:yes gene_type:complete
MLGNIIDTLRIVNGETKSIRFAQGSNYLPMNWKKGYKLASKIAKWEKNIDKTDE